MNESPPKMSVRTPQSSRDADAPLPIRTHPGPGDAIADTGSLSQIIDSAVRRLQHAASFADEVTEEAVSVASLCGEIQRWSIELSLLKDRAPGDTGDLDRLVESVSDGAQKSLSAIRRLGAHQCALQVSIAQAAVWLALLAEHMNRLEHSRALERDRLMLCQKAYANLARDAAMQALALQQILDSAWTTGEQDTH